jgi:beta-lactamase regulating signal transducer with metallopeptidase domain
MNLILAALVNGMVAGGAIAFAVWTALRLIPRNSLNAATRYAVWWIVLLVTAALPFWYLLSTAHSASAISAALPAPRSISFRSGLPQARRPAESGPSLPIPASSASIRPPSPTSSRRAFPITLAAGPWPARVLIVWLMSSILMFIRLVASAIILESRKARACKAPPMLDSQVAHWASSCGSTRRRIRLGSSREISTPLVAGPWRPSILIPARLLDDLNEGDLEQIGIHEAAHLARRDDYALLIQRTLEAVFALHPVVRRVSNRIDLEREIACDDFVVAATGNPKPYAACLARVVELSGGVRALPVAVAAAEDRSHLALRVETLLDNTRRTGTRLLGVRLAVAAACIAALSWGAAETRGLLAFAQPLTIPAALVPAQKAAPAMPRMDAAAPSALPGAPLFAQAVPPVPPPALPTAPGNPDAPMVFVPVEVRDPVGRFVTGLDKDVFKVRENGVDQAITRLMGPGERTDIFVLADPGIAPRAHRLDLMGFAAANAVVFPYDIGQRILPDAVRSVLQSEKNNGNRKAMFILTTSLANTRNYTPAELRAASGDITMPVYTFEVSDPAVPPEASADPASQPPILNEIALQTGGRHIAVPKPDDLPDAVGQALIAVRNLYFLGYTSSDTARDGRYRSLQVTVEAPRGLPKLTASSRPGYIARNQ